MSVDIRFYLMTYFIVALVIKSPKHGVAILLSLVPIGIALQGFVIYFYDLPGLLHNSGDIMKWSSMAQHLHTGLINYISSYAIGLFVGYLIANRIEIKSTLIRMALACQSINVVIFASTIPFLVSKANLIDDEKPLNTFTTLSSFRFEFDFVLSLITRVLIAIGLGNELLLGSTLKTLISIGFGGICYSAWNDNNTNTVVKLMSCRLFRVLDKISYSTFMIHFCVIWYDNMNRTHTLEYLGTVLVSFKITLSALYSLSQLIF